MTTLLEQVKHEGFILYNIPPEEQTPEICLAAVQNCGMALFAVHSQTPVICRASIKQNPHALQFVRDQTAEICLLAYSMDPTSVKHVINRRKLVPALMYLFNAPDQAYDPFTIVANIL